VNSDELRERFLRFFMAREHRRIESAPLVPVGDPTLMFTSAGMVQFKPYFTGKAQPPALRLTSVQRCFRTSDVDSVGDASHHTFFEMLGNFSVGDYFKAEAIPWAWEFITQELGIPRERLWNTVYTDDDVAFDLWVAQGQPPDRIYRYGEEEGNFWLSGDVGPCGPCSEIFYDWGEEYGCGPDCEPAHDCGRFLEIWNLVFMEKYQDDTGARTDLPKRNIDTGAGLERITRVLNNVPSTYDTDLFRSVLDAISAAIGPAYGSDEETTRVMRIIADHARAVAFLIADGQLPSNEGRGYVVRRLIRRCVYYGRVLGCERPYLAQVAGAVIERMAPHYPFLHEQRVNIQNALSLEEQRFGETLEAGVARLDDLIARLEGQGDALPGEEVFRLYSTYGVPRELTEELAARHGLRVDVEGFERELEAERERSRAQAHFRGEVLSEVRLQLAGAGRGGRFVGYETLESRTTIAGIFAGTRLLDRAVVGEQVQIVIEETPFYPEGGGQVGDRGEIRTDSGTVLVEDTQRDEGLILHFGRVSAGTVAVQQSAHASVDAQRRQNTTRNHTGTHVLHAALRAVLGPHVRQMGSLVEPERLRFDYQQPEAPTAEQRLAVMTLANEKIREDIPVVTKVMEKDAALGEGVLAFFGDKYGDEVRVVEMMGGDHRFSAELCGGTHVGETGEIGLLLLGEDHSIGAGLRRVEALTGVAAERRVQQLDSQLQSLARRLNTQPEGIEARIEALLNELDGLRRLQAAAQRASGKQTAESLAERAERVGSVAIVVERVDADQAAMREMGDVLRRKLGSATIVLAGQTGDSKTAAIVMLTDDLVPKLKAREILNGIGFRGGGSPGLAQGGGSDVAALEGALATARKLIKESLSA
jgi:alanyl-tRNA synthetase